MRLRALIALIVTLLVAIPARADSGNDPAEIARTWSAAWVFAPANEPVPALVASDDPWFTNPVLSGDCGDFMRGRPHSRSIVYRPPSYLHSKHWLSADVDVQATTLAFLAAARG